MSGNNGGRKGGGDRPILTQFSRQQSSQTEEPTPVLTDGPGVTSSGNTSSYNKAKITALIVSVILLLAAASTGAVFGTMKRLEEDDDNPDPTRAPSNYPNTDYFNDTGSLTPTTGQPSATPRPSLRTPQPSIPITGVPITLKPTNVPTGGTPITRFPTAKQSTSFPTKQPTNAPTIASTATPTTPTVSTVRPIQIKTLIDNGNYNPELVASFERVNEYLKSLITETRYPPTSIDHFSAFIACLSGYPIDPKVFGAKQTIDDLLIYVAVGGMDGTGNAIGGSMMCAPRLALIMFDYNDLSWLIEQGQEAVDLAVLHEIVHSLGFKHIYGQPDANGNLIYSRPYANEMYQALGGVGPLLLTPDGNHWLNLQLKDGLWDGVRDILNPILEGKEGFTPVTAAALKDLGWKVDMDAVGNIALTMGSLKVSIPHDAPKVKPGT